MQPVNPLLLPFIVGCVVILIGPALILSVVGIWWFLAGLVVNIMLLYGFMSRIVIKKAT